MEMPGESGRGTVVTIEENRQSGQEKEGGGQHGHVLRHHTGGGGTRKRRGSPWARKPSRRHAFKERSDVKIRTPKKGASEKDKKKRANPQLSSGRRGIRGRISWGRDGGLGSTGKTFRGKDQKTPILHNLPSLLITRPIGEGGGSI